MDLGKINALIAEHVMGKIPNNEELFDYSVEYNSKGYYREPEPYSSDIAAAWEALDKFQDSEGKFFNLSKSCGFFEEPAAWIVSNHTDEGLEEYGWDFGDDRKIRVRNESAPLAICLALLQAKDIEIAE